MKHLVDLHIHSVASGHAYSTIEENAIQAAKVGVQLIALTEHSIKMDGAPSWMYFSAIRRVPRQMHGVEVLRGVEANILNYQGDIDVEDRWVNNMDVVIASFHDVLLKPSTKADHTAGMLAVMEHACVDIIGHPGNPIFEMDIEAFVKGARDKNKLIEINNSSFTGSRKGSFEVCLAIAREAVRQQVGLVLSSDAHFSLEVGRLDKAQALIEAANVPEELIISRTPEIFKEYLFKKGKALDLKPD